jgi:small acid-soluble spore protein H (minor)
MPYLQSRPIRFLQSETGALRRLFCVPMRICGKDGVNTVQEVKTMNIQRAKEIAGSEEMIDVLYYGASFYIDQVDETAGTVRIYSRENPDDERQVVPVDALSEPESMELL